MLVAICLSRGLNRLSEERGGGVAQLDGGMISCLAACSSLCYRMHSASIAFLVIQPSSNEFLSDVNFGNDLHHRRNRRDVWFFLTSRVFVPNLR